MIHLNELNTILYNDNIMFIPQNTNIIINGKRRYTALIYSNKLDDPDKKSFNTLDDLNDIIFHTSSFYYLFIYIPHSIYVYLHKMFSQLLNMDINTHNNHPSITRSQCYKNIYDVPILYFCQKDGIEIKSLNRYLDCEVTNNNVQSKDQLELFYYYSIPNISYLTKANLNRIKLICSGMDDMLFFVNNALQFKDSHVHGGYITQEEHDMGVTGHNFMNDLFRIIIDQFPEHAENIYI